MTYTRTEQATSFQAAKAAAKKARGAVAFEADAGEGWKSLSFYCPRRRRVVCLSINPRGDVIV